MTNKQDQVVDQIKQLLTEHFDAWVLVTELKDIDDEGHTSTRGMFYGSITQTLGLLEHEKICLTKQILNNDKEDE